MEAEIYANFFKPNSDGRRVKSQKPSLRSIMF
jgi:hypothetical protein